MKILAECKTNAASANYGFSTGVLGQEYLPASGVWNRRDEFRINVTLLHGTRRRPNPEEVSGGDPLALRQELVESFYRLR